MKQTTSLPENGKPVSSLIETSSAGNVFRFFSEILKIPRPSGKEEKIRAYLLEFAKSRNLESFSDNAGNVIIRKAAASGFENVPCIILQGHMDMVCEKETDFEIDFENDPITAYYENDLIHSVGTTLGADDGAGVSLILDILDSAASGKFECGQIEAIITVDEEVGCNGAKTLSADSFDGKYLINLDWEEDTICLGCAGSVKTHAVFNLNEADISGQSSDPVFEIVIDGLRGGHSGAEIHLGRANAIKILTRLLMIPENISLFRFEGGNLSNAIPRHAEAVFSIHSENDNENEISESIDKIHMLAENICRDYSEIDPDISVTIRCMKNEKSCEDEQSLLSGFMMSPEFSSRFLKCLAACPTGVIDADFENGFVKTSINLASVRCYPEIKKIEIVTLQRSLSETALDGVSESAESVFLLAGASVSRDGAHPGWTPDRNSILLKTAKSVYEKTFGKEPVMTATHAGLECGCFFETKPDLEMISIGPIVIGEHTPQETLSISSVEKMRIYLRNLLNSIE